MQSNDGRNYLTREVNTKAIIPSGSVQNMTEKIESAIQFEGGVGATTTGL